MLFAIIFRLEDDFSDETIGSAGSNPNIYKFSYEILFWFEIYNLIPFIPAREDMRVFFAFPETEDFHDWTNERLVVFQLYFFLEVLNFNEPPSFILEGNRVFSFRSSGQRTDWVTEGKNIGEADLF